MPYSTVQPPFTLKLRDMPKQELRRYYEWFMEVLPQRIEELARAVRETPGFESWQPDFTPASLDALGEWLVGQVETRSRTPGGASSDQRSSSFSDGHSCRNANEPDVFTGVRHRHVLQPSVDEKPPITQMGAATWQQKGRRLWATMPRRIWPGISEPGAQRRNCLCPWAG